MPLLRRSQNNDVLYLMPIRLGNEQLPENSIRMLYCNAKGLIDSAIIDKPVYQKARNGATKLKRARKNFATIGVEVTPGKTIPCTVEIEPEQVWALNNILEHAIKRRKIPDILKKYPGEIIQLGEAKRKEFEEDLVKARHSTPVESTPKVLYRLPYYQPEDIEVSIPTYKARHSFPLIILTRLSSNEETGQDMQRALILDADGDLAIMRFPPELMDQAEKGLQEFTKAGRRDGCLVYSQHPDGLIMSHIELNKQQRRALDSIVQHFEKTGHCAQPISSPVQSVIIRAREMASILENHIPPL
ncbi:MAG: hypothetical protein JSW16_04795 [Dehalococcoidales bacterium]|nr:MAG: hypothetical protein JSW16_04795 [Dehalococcoidales bacterium]